MQRIQELQGATLTGNADRVDARSVHGLAGLADRVERGGPDLFDILFHAASSRVKQVHRHRSFTEDLALLRRHRGFDIRRA